MVSHDLRNPLNIAAGRLGLARSECDSDHLDAVANAHDRMETLIDDLLTLSRQGEPVGETELVDLGTLAEGCWGTVSTTGASLCVAIDRQVQADPSRLRQLFENLYRNAIEHTGSDTTIRVGDCDGGFYVEDDGPGIPKAEREDVFETGYSTTDDGTGFGLSIVREVVEAHGWDIGVSEADSGGARFEITGVTFTPE